MADEASIATIVLVVSVFVLLAAVGIWLQNRDHQREMDRIRRTHGAAALDAVARARARIEQEREDT